MREQWASGLSTTAFICGAGVAIAFPSCLLWGLLALFCMSLFFAIFFVVPETATIAGLNCVGIAYAIIQTVWSIPWLVVDGGVLIVVAIVLTVSAAIWCWETVAVNLHPWEHVKENAIPIAIGFCLACIAFVGLIDRLRVAF